MNDQNFVKLVIDSKEYKIFPDETGIFPEFVNFVEPLQEMTSIQLCENRDLLQHK